MFKTLNRLARLLRINLVLARYSLDDLILSSTSLAPLHFFAYCNPWYWQNRNRPRGQRLRLALQDLGPIFVKAGQILSTRVDLLPEDIALELALLQDRVAPFPGHQAQAMIESALKTPLSHVFAEFDPVALASASIAQVHAATLHTGQAVVVKVLRPDVKKHIDRDLDLLYILARLADRFLKNARAFKPLEIVSEIASTLHDELDLLREGANAAQLRRNFANSPDLHIPEIFWPYSSTQVLVMERVYGIPINDLAQLQNAGLSLRRISELNLDLFFTQVFRDNFFHADIHPGNFFISAVNPDQPQFLAVDFGIAGSLSTKDQRYLAENMLAFLHRDYRRVAELHISSGWLPPDTRPDQFEGAIRAVCEPIFERPLKDISFAQLLFRLFQTARRFEINIQPQLILLQKSLFGIESLSRQLSPEIDLWKTAQPYLERWLKEQVGVSAFFKRVRANLPLWSEKLPDVPNLIFEILQETQLRQERERFRLEHPEKTTVKVDQGRSKLLYGCGLGFLLSSAGVWFEASHQLIHPSHPPAVSLTLGGLGVLAILLAI